MPPNDIRSQLRKRPSHAIRIYVSDGATYEIRHPEMAMVSATEIVIANDQDKEGLPQRLAYVDPLHVTRIEPINGSKQKPMRKSKTK